MLASVIPIELDALVYLTDGIVDEADGFGAVAALVGLRHVELVLGGAEMVECRLHVRLVGDGTRCQEPAEARDGENEKRDGGAPGGAPEQGCDQGNPPLFSREDIKPDLNGSSECSFHPK
jgi:hypothetical protein